MKVKYHTNQTFKFDPARHAEQPKGKSLTQPDLAFTVRELLDRFTRGSMPPVVKQEIWEENANFDSADPTRRGDFDLSDAVVEAEKLKELKNKRQEDFDKKLQAKKDLALKQKKEFDEWKKTQVEEKKEDKKEPSNKKE